MGARIWQRAASKLSQTEPRILTALSLQKPKAPPETEARRRLLRRIGVLVAFVALAVLCAVNPPFVVRPLAGSGVSESDSGRAQSVAAQFVEPIWESKVLPAIRGRAQDIATVLSEIRANSEAAGQKYGRREATNPYNYIVKGTGKVIEVNTQSQAGTATIEIPGLAERIALQIGPVVRGTSVRDATGVVSFNQFSNQLDYADVAKEMNTRALRAAVGKVSPASLAGKTITFLGVFTFDPRAKPPLLVTPVQIDL
jgi:predicted lipoprotein